jgi:hypothetical protein
MQLAVVQSRFGLLAVIDVDERPDVPETCPATRPAWLSGIHRPVVDPVGPPQPKVHMEPDLLRLGGAERIADGGAVIHMHGLEPAPAQTRGHRLAGVRLPALAAERASASGVGEPEHGRRGVGHVAQLRFTLAQLPVDPVEIG